MPDPFVHLHVASGFSLRYGATHPDDLVARAAEHGMDTLALTDRDGAYGAVRFATACAAAGLRPVLGVDLAYRTTAPAGADARGRRTPAPVRGGAFRDLPSERGGLPRVTVLASADTRGGRAGWAALCRLVSAVHLDGERGRPVLDLGVPGLVDAVGELLGSGDLVVLLGPASELGAAVTRRRDDHARAALEPWRRLVPASHLVVEVVDHRLPGSGRTRADWGPGTTPHAARTAALARAEGLSSVLTNAVRYAERRDAVTVDVLDAARRLVALDARHLERRNAEGHLKSGKEMHDVADGVARAAGLGPRGARDLLARTRGLAERCVLDPRADLGLGEVHLPELDAPGDGDDLLRRRCEAAIGGRYGGAPRQRIWKRLDDELRTISSLGYASYFLTVAEVVDLVRAMGVRCAARGSGAGSLVNHLLGVSGVDPIRHDLLMERFLSPLRDALPDIDLDVESARRLEVYDAILDRFGAERCLAVSMRETYRVRHAVRDVGGALGMPVGEIDALARSFPHVRARDARAALRDLPELRATGASDQRLELFLDLVERLDGLPRHVAVHPCAVLLSDRTLLDRTPVEASFAGYPMSQFDKDDVEELGLLKLDVLGIRLQSAMAHAVAEVRRVDGVEVDLDDESQVPFDDPATYALISSARTLGVFQIESPGQRELIAKSGIDDFAEIITDISLFRPGPVGSDMITPYLEVKHGWRQATYLHDDLRPVLEQTRGVVVFHEQVIEIIAILTGCSLAEGDSRRRALGHRDGMEETRQWLLPRALARGYPATVVHRVWEVVSAFAAFGFCKAHAAAFALPTFQSAWLKTHWPAHFLAGVLTHDPGMYPKRLILDEVRRLGIEVRGLDVDRSEQTYVVEPTPDGGYAVRVALAEVRGITAAEVERVVAARPFASLADFWQRAHVSRPVVERLVLAGGLDGVHGLGVTGGLTPRGRVTRRDLLLQVAELDRHERAVERAGRGRGLAGRRVTGRVAERADGAQRADGVERAETRASSATWARAAAQGRSTRPPPRVTSVQLALELGDTPRAETASGLPELTPAESTAAELEVLGLDVTRHVVDGYADLLDALGVTRSRDLLRGRSGSELLVAGVKVATQTPPIRSGRRVVFLTLDDATGPVDATFFEDAQGPYARTVFASWLLVVRGDLRRTGHRGVSVRATGAWDLTDLHALWRHTGTGAVLDLLAAAPRPARTSGAASAGPRVPRHSSGFARSPYSDVRPPGDDPATVPRGLWHRSPGSPG